MSVRGAAPAATAILIAALTAGCVTETPARRRAASSAAHAPSTGDALPDGPIASPVPRGATSTSRILVQLAPLGSIAYDGQVLPLISPDGRFIASQEGEAPTWPTLLAHDGAEAPLATRLAVYQRAPSASSGGTLHRAEPPNPLPPGLLLGRSADDAGFLVESPRDDGSRWIGHVQWLSGTITWLVQGGHVNAHAVLTPTGGLLFTRRAVGADRAELVLRRPDGSEASRTDPTGSYAMPMSTSDPSVAYALVRSRAGLDLEAIRLPDPGDGPPRFGASLVRRALSPTSDAALAYQVAAPLQGMPLSRTPHSDDPLVIYHPKLGRMAAFDAAGGSFALLPPGSIAAARWATNGRNGYLCTTPAGVVYAGVSSESAAASPRRTPDARVIAEPMIPRVTTDPDCPVLLLGPSPQDPRRLQVMLLRPASDSEGSDSE